MTGYSLSFFVCGKYDMEWWDTLTADKAERAAERARAAGCVPRDFSPIKCGVATAWEGPSLGAVMDALKRYDESKR